MKINQRNMMTYEIDTENDGYVRIAGAVTIDRYKATSMDIPALLPQNRAFCEFMDEQFNLGFGYKK